MNMKDSIFSKSHMENKLIAYKKLNNVLSENEEIPNSSELQIWQQILN